MLGLLAIGSLNFWPPALRPGFAARSKFFGFAKKPRRGVSPRARLSLFCLFVLHNFSEVPDKIRVFVFGCLQPLTKVMNFEKGFLEKNWTQYNFSSFELQLTLLQRIATT